MHAAALRPISPGPARRRPFEGTLRQPDGGGSSLDLPAAVDDAERIMRPLDDECFDLHADRYSHRCQFVPALLDAFVFRGSAPDGGDLMRAIELVRELNRAGRRKVPERAPLGFVPARWRA